MKEYIFRVWHTPANKYLYFGSPDVKKINHGYSMYFVPEEDYSRVECDGFFEEDRIFERFTGLIDSKGQKIFEGDILAENYTAEMAALGSDAHVGDVYFESGAFLIRGGGTLFDLTYSVTPNIVDGYSVVGNVHENKDIMHK